LQFGDAVDAHPDAQQRRGRSEDDHGVTRQEFGHQRTTSASARSVRSTTSASASVSASASRIVTLGNQDSN
jgi:hypothetical protein